MKILAAFALLATASAFQPDVQIFQIPDISPAIVPQHVLDEIVKFVDIPEPDVASPFLTVNFVDAPEPESMVPSQIKFVDAAEIQGDAIVKFVDAAEIQGDAIVKFVDAAEIQGDAIVKFVDAAEIQGDARVDEVKIVDAAEIQADARVDEVKIVDAPVAEEIPAQAYESVKFVNSIHTPAEERETVIIVDTPLETIAAPELESVRIVDAPLEDLEQLELAKVLPIPVVPVMVREIPRQKVYNDPRLRSL